MDGVGWERWERGDEYRLIGSLGCGDRGSEGDRERERERERESGDDI